MASAGLGKCRRAGFSLLLALLPAGAAAAEPPAAELFARSPRIVEMLPSPSGDRVAVILTADHGRRQLGVLDLPPREPMKVIAAYSDGDVQRVRWKDRDLLREASPLHRVRELKVPVLLAHGADDPRVPIEHASKFVSAARDAGVAVDYVSYADEGHGWHHTKNHADFYRRVEKFLAASLGAPAAAAAK